MVAQILMLLPYERVTVQTPLTPEQVRRRLVEVVEPRQLFRFFSRNHLPYEGEIRGDQFEVSRIIHYRNSFLPLVKGRIRPSLNGSVIDLTMYPHVLVIVFIGIWFAIPLSIIAGIMVSLLQANWTTTLDLTVVSNLLLFLLIGYLLVIAGFKFESHKSVAFFQKLFSI